MGDMNEYILSKKIRKFTTKIGLRELITDIHGSMKPGTTRAKKNRQYMGYGAHKALQHLKEGIPLFTSTPNHTTDYCV